MSLEAPNLSTIYSEYSSPMPVTTLESENSHKKRKKENTAWDDNELTKLTKHIDTYGAKHWNEAAKAIGTKNYQQCRLKGLELIANGLGAHRLSLTNAQKKIIARPSALSERKIRGAPKAPWTPKEDEYLKKAIQTHGYQWTLIAEAMPGRTDKNCRGRWYNQLDPTLDHSPLLPEEKKLIDDLAAVQKNWVVIAAQVDKMRKETLGLSTRRSDNRCKNYFNTSKQKNDPHALSQKASINFEENFEDADFSENDAEITHEYKTPKPVRRLNFNQSPIPSSSPSPSSNYSNSLTLNVLPNLTVTPPNLAALLAHSNSFSSSPFSSSSSPLTSPFSLSLSPMPSPLPNENIPSPTSLIRYRYIFPNSEIPTSHPTLSPPNAFEINKRPAPALIKENKDAAKESHQKPKHANLSKPLIPIFTSSFSSSKSSGATHSLSTPTYPSPFRGSVSPPSKLPDPESIFPECFPGTSSSKFNLYTGAAPQFDPDLEVRPTDLDE